MDKWIEIDIEAVLNNLRSVKTVLNNQARLMAVVKANAYGHGAAQTACLLNQNGVDFFGVSFLEEAWELREAGIKDDILIFSPVTNQEQALAAINAGLILSVTSKGDLNVLKQVSGGFSRPARIHLKIETGLGRFGLGWEESLYVCQEIFTDPQFKIEGIYTHFADPSSPAFTDHQFRQFMQIVQQLAEAGYVIPMRHVANSVVFLRSPDMYLDAVRIGTLLSGQHPVGQFPIHLDLKDPYTFKSRIISLKTLPPGSSLGY